MEVRLTPSWAEGGPPINAHMVLHRAIKFGIVTRIETGHVSNGQPRPYPKGLGYHVTHVPKISWDPLRVCTRYEKKEPNFA